MKIIGIVEDGTGTNSRLAKKEDPGFLDALGYRPFLGTLNLRVSKRDRGRILWRPGKKVSGTLFWRAELNGTVCHVRLSRDYNTLELVHPERLRDTYRNGDRVELNITARRMRLSAAIMAHPVREESALRVQAALDRDVPIIFDENPTPSSDPLQRWTTGRRCWEAHDPDADYHLVLQDDVSVSIGLLEGLENALTQLGPEGLMSAYTGTGRPDQKNVLRAHAHAAEHGHTWMSTKSLNWGPAIIAPTSTIPEMLAWCEQWIPRKTPPASNYDKAIGLFYRDQMGYRTWYTVPSLVQTGNLPSLIGHDYGDPRRAHSFYSGDARHIDWSLVPYRGLNPYWRAQ